MSGKFRIPTPLGWGVCQESYEQIVENYRQLHNFLERSDLPFNKKTVLMLHASDLKNEALALSRNVDRLRNLIKVFTDAEPIG